MEGILAGSRDGVRRPTLCFSHFVAMRKDALGRSGAGRLSPTLKAPSLGRSRTRRLLDPGSQEPRLPQMELTLRGDADLVERDFTPTGDVLHGAAGDSGWLLLTHTKPVTPKAPPTITTPSTKTGDLAGQLGTRRFSSSKKLWTRIGRVAQAASSALAILRCRERQLACHVAPDPVGSSP